MNEKSIKDEGKKRKKAVKQFNKYVFASCRKNVTENMPIINRMIIYLLLH